MRKRKAAFISIFSALTLSFTVALSFLLIDGVRMAGMGKLFQQRVNLTARNMSACYQRELYEGYGLLGIDQLYSKVGKAQGLKNQLEEELAYAREGVDLLRYESFEAENMQYQLLTDGQGAVYRKQAAWYMTSFLPEEVISDLLHTFNIEDCEEAAGLSEEVYTEATDALGEALRNLEDSQSQDNQSNKEPGDRKKIEENEITEYAQKKEHPILSTILGEENFSENLINEEHCPSRRVCAQGTLGYEETNTVENFLSLNYARKKFLNYTTANPEGEGLQYQLEYLVGGKPRDSENLGIVIRRIMEIREGVRFLELLSNPEERNNAWTLATAIVGFTGNPALIEAVQMGILLAKAFDQAIEDVRDLVAGKKIPITDKFQSVALDYSQYVIVLLLLQNQDQVAMRSLDVIENEVNRNLKEGDFHCDQTVTRMKSKVTANRPWLLCNFMVIKVPNLITMKVSANLDMSYQ